MFSTLTCVFKSFKFVFVFYVKCNLKLLEICAPVLFVLVLLRIFKCVSVICLCFDVLCLCPVINHQ